MTTQLITLGDPHINSTVGLCAPSVTLDDGGTYHLNRTQSWLHSCLQDDCKEIARLPGRKIGLLMGDLGELDSKGRSVQVITRNKADIIRLVQRTLEPFIELFDSIIVIRGTAAHEGKSAWLEETIAQDYDHAIKDGERASWYHMRCVIDGVRLDIAHHANMTSTPWGRGNSANSLAQKITWEYMVNMRQPAPDIAIRAHNHKIAQSWGFPVLVRFNPAWTTATEYCYRRGYENTLADIGCTIWTLDNGTYSYRDILHSPKESRKVWSLTI